MDMANVLDNMQADLSEERATVRALIAESGAPILTEDALAEAAHDRAVFAIGDAVAVLNAWRLPKIEDVIGVGVVERMTVSGAETLYWVSGFKCGRTARVLRPVEPTHQAKRSVCPDCGGGWVFDFRERRIYCRQCEAANAETA